jgi:hypothetical protein
MRIKTFVATALAVAISGCNVPMAWASVVWATAAGRSSGMLPSYVGAASIPHSHARLGQRGPWWTKWRQGDRTYRRPTR